MVKKRDKRILSVSHNSNTVRDSQDLSFGRCYRNLEFVLRKVNKVKQVTQRG